MRAVAIHALCLALLALAGCAATTEPTGNERQASRAITEQRLDDGSTQIIIATDDAFAYDSIVLQPAIQAELERRSAGLRAQRVIIAGYTDNVGAASYNQTLSRERAQSVANALVLQGFAAGQLQVEGFGEQSPRASNETAAGRRENRRIELLFTPVE